MWLEKLIFFCLLIEIINAGDVGDTCTIDQRDGICSLVYDCVVAFSAITSGGHHKLPRCGFQGEVEIVCCPPSPTTNGPPKPLHSRMGIQNSRPADQACKNITETYNPPSATYILGGETAEEGEFPHMVALGYQMTKDYVFLCGGSLITSQHVLTAVHCVNTIERIQPTLVRVGVLNITDNKWNDDTDYGVDEVFVHPEYKRSRKYHDLSVLRLTKPVRTSQKAFPACLYTTDTEPTKLLSITGWGKTDVRKAATSGVLLKATLVIVSRETCNPLYTRSRKLPDGILDGQICARDPTGIMDTCQGDSGGPLQGQTGTDGHYRIVGVTSFGSGCGSSIPGVYTRIYKYLDWIESVVWPSQ